MNKIATLAVVAALAPFAFAGSTISTGGGGNTASVAIHANAVIYLPVTIGETGDWSFGSLVLNSTGQPFSVNMNSNSGYSNAVNCATYNGSHGLATSTPTIWGSKDPNLEVCFTTQAVQLTRVGNGLGSGTLTLTPDQISNATAGYGYAIPLTGKLAGDGKSVGTFSGTVTVTACYM